MTISARKLIAALSVTMLMAGPALADSYYQGIDPNNPPGTQNNRAMPMMRNSAAPVDTMPTGSINRTTAPAPIYRERAPSRGYQGGEGDYYQGIVAPSY